MYLCLCSDGEYQQTGVNNRVNKFDNKLIIIFFQKWNLNIFEEVSNYVAFVNNNKWELCNSIDNILIL